jgi:hypothetical protein
MRRQQFVALLVAAAVAFSAAACAEPNGFAAGISVENSTQVPLHFTLIRPNGEAYEFGQEVAPGLRVALISGPLLRADRGLTVNMCTVGDLIAYGPDGSEVARHAPPLCAAGSPVWIIGAAATPTG